MFEEMLNFTKNVSRLVTITAQQIDIKLMHPEKFRQNFLVRIYFMKEFNFLIHHPEHRKILAWGFSQCKT